MEKTCVFCLCGRRKQENRIRTLSEICDLLDSGERYTCYLSCTHSMRDALKANFCGVPTLSFGCIDTWLRVYRHLISSSTHPCLFHDPKEAISE
ncbi:hypothetical protein CSUI_007731 [Cystoisospora suis]|uniref:Uncharacterized protein n=1 Tax=Cystoisospora suis TaxID=483139 RepID=A0A2C6KCM5_9APIC|nr:hypothetical protein CSUI_007731 [Cystoisospora suis]